jgi:RNA polymerase sigma-70 factor, ECF subfamily
VPERSNADWVGALSAGAGPDPNALADLRGHLERAALFAIRRRLATTRGVMADEMESLAEDSAQEALLLALQNLGTFRGEARFVTWASAIAVATALATLRRRMWRDLSLDHMPDGWHEPPALPRAAAAGSNLTCRRSELRSGLLSKR